MARYINTWMGLPDVVSRGNQKNFSALTLSLTSMGGAVADRTLYQHLVALALLFREAVTLARVYPAYRANIVAYTVAWLAEATARRLDLDRIWKEQKVPAELIQMMALIMSGIQEGIVVGSDRMNVTEWCKKPDAWQQIRHLDLLPVNALANLTTWEPIVLLRTRPVNESPVSEDDDPEQDISEQSMDTEESEHPVARA